MIVTSFLCSKCNSIGFPGISQQKVGPNKWYIGQQKVEPKPPSHFTDLQTMCKTNIPIWDCFYHNRFGHCHQQNTKSPELFYLASTSSSKICVSPLNTWSLWTSICQRETHLSRPKPLIARMHADPLVEHTINSAIGTTWYLKCQGANQIRYIGHDA